MTDLNDRIRHALRADEDEALAALADEPDIFEQVLQTFRGRSRWLVLLSIGAGIVFMILCVVCAVKFFHAEGMRAMIAWAVGFLACLGAITAMKVWYWMELQKNALAREIKRLELQVARLVER